MQVIVDHSTKTGCVCFHAVIASSSRDATGLGQSVSSSAGSEWIRQDKKWIFDYFGRDSWGQRGFRFERWRLVMPDGNDLVVLVMMVMVIQ